MLIGGGGFCLALPPAKRMRPPADGTVLRFRSSADASGPANSATKRNEWQRIITKCFEML
jgi:hypothetical protein